MKGNISTVSVA